MSRHRIRGLLAAVILLLCACSGSTASSSIPSPLGATPSQQATGGPAASTTAALSTPAAATPLSSVFHGIECDHLGCQGDLPAGQVATRAFVPGTTFRLADAGWFNTEDEPGEFNLRRVDHPQAVIFFWIDPVPLMNDVPVPDLAPTRDRVLGWLQRHPFLSVSHVVRMSLGGDAHAVTFRLAYLANGPTAPECNGATCFDLFHFEGPGHDFNYGSGLGEPNRMYLADIMIGGTRHTLVVSVTEQDPADRGAFSGLERAAVAVLATMTVGSHM